MNHSPEITLCDNGITFTKDFTRDSHWLVHEDGGDMGWHEYYFAPKIDRSYKGKDPDEGMPELYIDSEDFEAIKDRFDVLIKCKGGSG